MSGWLRRTGERLAAWWRGDMRVVRMGGDTLPDQIPQGRVVNMMDDGMNWSAGLLCPCGCGDVIELLLIRAADPHWTLSVDWLNRPTLQPSVWRKTGCRAHFFVRRGQIVWAEPRPLRQ